MHAEAIEARVSLPTTVRPHLSVGVGRYAVAAYDSQGNRRVSPDAAATIPVSAGMETLVNDSVGLEAEGTYWLLFAHGEPGRAIALASLWSATLGGRAYF